MSPLYCTDTILNTDNNVNAQFLSEDEDNTQTIANSNDDNNDSIMFNIDDDSILEQSLPNLNNNERQETGRQEFTTNSL